MSAVEKANPYRGSGGRYTSGWPSSQDEMDRMVQDPRAYTHTVDGAEIKPDTWLIVFHGTERDTKEHLLTRGFDSSTKPTSLARQRFEANEYAEYAPGAGLSSGLYVSGHPNDASGYGHTMVVIRVRAGALAKPPESTAPGEGLQAILRALKDANGAVILGRIPSSDIHHYGARAGYIPQLKIGEFKTESANKSDQMCCDGTGTAEHHRHNSIDGRCCVDDPPSIDAGHPELAPHAWNPIVLKANPYRGDGGRYTSGPGSVAPVPVDAIRFNGRKVEAYNTPWAPDAGLDARVNYALSMPPHYDEKLTRVRDSYVVDDDRTTRNNHALRTSTATPAQMRWAHAIDRYINLGETTQRGVVYRGEMLPEEVAQSIKPGDTLSSQAFQSASPDRRMALTYLSIRSKEVGGVPVTHLIDMPAGTHIGIMDATEWVLPRGTSTVVDSVSKDDQGYTVHSHLAPRQVEKANPYRGPDGKYISGPSQGSSFDGHERRVTDSYLFPGNPTPDVSYLSPQIDRRFNNATSSIAADAGVKPTKVSELYVHWGSPEWSSDPEWGAVQLEAQKIFDLDKYGVEPDPPDDYSSGSDSNIHSLAMELDDIKDGTSEFPGGGRGVDVGRDEIRKIVKSQYNYTQDWLKSNHISQIPVLRGLKLDRSDVEAAGIPIVDSFKDAEGAFKSVKMHSNPLSAFSTDPAYAAWFSAMGKGDTYDPNMLSVVIRGVVPAKDVMSVGHSTGMGASAVHEVIVMGREQKFEAVAVREPPQELWGFDEEGQDVAEREGKHLLKSEGHIYVDRDMSNAEWLKSFKPLGVAKLDPYHDERGRFSHSPSATAEDEKGWSQGAYGYRVAAAQILGADVVGYRPAGTADNPEDFEDFKAGARRLLESVNDAAPINAPMYREINVQPKDRDEFFATLTPNSTMDLPLVGFSKDPGEVHQFGSEVHFVLETGAKGVLISRVSSVPQEKEVITGGRFLIESAEKVGEQKPNPFSFSPPKPGHWEVRLKQLDTFALPGSAKFAASQYKPYRFDYLFDGPVRKLEKFNPNHDARGRFSQGSRAAVHEVKHHLSLTGEPPGSHGDWVHVGDEGAGRSRARQVEEQLNLGGDEEKVTRRVILHDREYAPTMYEVAVEGPALNTPKAGYLRGSRLDDYGEASRTGTVSDQFANLVTGGTKWISEGKARTQGWVGPDWMVVDGHVQVPMSPEERLKTAQDIVDDHENWPNYQLEHSYAPAEQSVLDQLKTGKKGIIYYDNSGEQTDEPSIVAPASMVTVKSTQPLHSPVGKSWTPIILKYNENHDARGRFAQGPGNRVLSQPEETAQQLVSSRGGFTVHPLSGRVPKTGYQVGGVRADLKLSAGVSREDFAQALLEMRNNHSDLFHLGGRFYAGGWVNEGTLVLEPSERVKTRAEAERLARERNQVSIWSNTRQIEIPTGGTGEFTGKSSLRGLPGQLGRPHSGAAEVGLRTDGRSDGGRVGVELRELAWAPLVLKANPYRGSGGRYVSGPHKEPSAASRLGALVEVDSKVRALENSMGSEIDLDGVHPKLQVGVVKALERFHAAYPALKVWVKTAQTSHELEAVEDAFAATQWKDEDGSWRDGVSPFQPPSNQTRLLLNLKDWHQEVKLSDAVNEAEFTGNFVLGPDGAADNIITHELGHSLHDAVGGLSAQRIAIRAASGQESRGSDTVQIDGNKIARDMGTYATYNQYEFLAEAFKQVNAEMATGKKASSEAWRAVKALQSGYDEVYGAP